MARSSQKLDYGHQMHKQYNDATVGICSLCLAALGLLHALRTSKQFRLSFEQLTLAAFTRIGKLNPFERYLVD